MVADNKITLLELGTHNSSESVWIAIEGKVYDVTAFIIEHPGGEDPIMEWAGKDATEAFDDVGHSRDAKEMMQEYVIGVLDISS